MPNKDYLDQLNISIQKTTNNPVLVIIVKCDMNDGDYMTEINEIELNYPDNVIYARDAINAIKNNISMLLTCNPRKDYNNFPDDAKILLDFLPTCRWLDYDYGRTIESIDVYFKENGVMYPVTI